MSKLMNVLMLSCRRATELVEKRRHCRLEIQENIQLKMHLSMCKFCSRYALQTALIDQLLNNTTQSLPPPDTAELQERIIKELPES